MEVGKGEENGDISNSVNSKNIKKINEDKSKNVNSSQ